MKPKLLFIFFLHVFKKGNAVLEIKVIKVFELLNLINLVDLVNYI